MSRILARDYAFKLTFQFLFNKDFYQNKEDEESELVEEDKIFSEQIFCAVKENFEFIKLKVEQNLKNNMKVTDLYKLDYAIIIVAIACIDYLNETSSLSINEAVNLAKKYSTDKSPSFVNGLLASIYKK